MMEAIMIIHRIIIISIISSIITKPFSDRLCPGPPGRRPLPRARALPSAQAKVDGKLML